MTGEKRPVTEPEPVNYALMCGVQPRKLLNRSHSFISHRPLCSSHSSVDCDRLIKTRTLEAGTCAVNGGGLSRRLAYCRSL